MTTVIEDKTRKSGRQEPILTNHFNERYYERVLDKAPVGKIISQKNKVLKEILNNMLPNEKQLLQMFGESQRVIVPYMKKFQIVVSQNKFITIY